MNLYFLLLAVCQEIILDFSTPCTSGCNSVVQRVESFTDTISHVSVANPFGNNY